MHPFDSESVLLKKHRQRILIIYEPTLLRKLFRELQHIIGFTRDFPWFGIISVVSNISEHR